MSISAQAISEEAISGQFLLVPTLIPGSVLPWAAASNIKPVTQKWPEESFPEVYNPRQIAP